MKTMKANEGRVTTVECYESRQGDPTNAKGSGVLVSSVTECAGEAGRGHRGSHAIVERILTP